MTVGIVTIELFIHQANSLKDKRMVLESLKKRMRNNFNVAVTQIDEEDKWQRSRLAIATVSAARSGADSMLNRLINFIEKDDRLDIIDYEMELI
ncbi:MAG: DUF503 domain-containing protein, partial [Candidatus Omnitrophica bacterium]|nr:DUF503 domain-containing protein [Candidatus Omnitrophota bacterium]